MFETEAPAVFTTEELGFSGHAKWQSSNPHVVAVELPNPGSYGSRDNLDFTLRFNDRVRIAKDRSSISIPIETGYTMHEASYLKGSGSKELIFRWSPARGDLDRDGITLGRVDPITGLRDFDFTGDIKSLEGKSVVDSLPNVDTSSILVDARGPSVISFSKPAIVNNQASIKVRFDRETRVKGSPSIPIEIDGERTLLSYSRGNGTKTLVFESKITQGVQGETINFDALGNQVILLPGKSTLADKGGNPIELIGADFKKDLSINGSKAALLGSHFEFLKTLSASELNALMSQDRAYYDSGVKINPLLPASEENTLPYLRDYQLPDYPQATHSVDLYRIAYRSRIPGQERFTTNYGLAAIPQTEATSIPIILMEHQTVFNRASAASQAFSFPENSGEAISLYSTKTKVAHYAGQGFGVIIGDQYGLGNNLEDYAYFAKTSNQQSSLDNYNSASELLSSLNKKISNLYVAGWSSGGISAVGLAERLEQEGVELSGVAIAGGPLDLAMNINAGLWNPRDGSDGNTPEAPWINNILVLSAFSLGSYSGQDKVAEDILGNYYEAGRRIYTSDYKSIIPAADGSGVLVDGYFLPYNVKEILPLRYSTSPRAFAKSDYVKLLEDSSVGRLPLSADLLMVYGEQDEVISNPVAQSLYNWQRINYGKQNIELVTAKDANHRAALFTMMDQSIPWFTARMANM
jgi:pimeloyl-ACP methyl ester carboxylesterase